MPTMAAMADGSGETEENADELADRFDGVELDCDDIDGTAEFTVKIPEDVIADLPERPSRDEGDFAGNLVQSHLKRILKQEDSLIDIKTMAKELDPIDVHHSVDEEMRVFEVWARFR